MCWSPTVHRRIYESKSYKAAHQTIHEHLTPEFHRTWTGVVLVCLLGLGLPLMFSCYSTTTKDLHLYKVKPAIFLEGFFSAEHNDAFVVEPQINGSQPNELSSLPETYYFGISGICRQFNSNNLVCNRSFPVVYDIPQVIFDDLGSKFNISLPSNFTSETGQSTVDSMSKATAALLIVSIVWAVITAIVVIIFPTSFVGHAVPLFILATVTLSAWVIGNSIFLKQAAAYNLLGGEEGAGSLGLGPGFGIFVAYLVCCLALTPVMAFWSIVSIIVLATLVVVITIEVVIVMMVCLGACGGGQTTYTYYDNSGFTS